MLFSIPGVENLSQTTVTIIALVLALVLVAFFGLILRRLTGGRLSLKSDRGRARQPRLGIVDVYDLDRQRQLILLRRDNVEHLLLVGGPNDVVVETNIVRAGGSRLPAATVEAQDRAEPAVERNVEIAPVRPVLEPIGMRPPEPVAARLGTADTMARGAIEPALKPSSVNAAPARRAAERGPTERGAQPDGRTAFGEPVAETSRVAAGGGQPPSLSAAPKAGVGRTDMAKQLEEALARPAPEPRSAPARTLDLPRATPVAQPGRLMSAFRKTEPVPSAASNGPAEPAPAAEPPPIPTTVEIDPETVEAEIRQDPVLQDPVRQDTIRQEPVRQQLARQEQPYREPEPQKRERNEAEQNEVLGGHDGSHEPLRTEPVRDEIVEATGSGIGALDAPPSLPETPIPPPPRPDPAAPVAPNVVASSPQPSQAAPPGRNDPFSIEDIEAEFARLLGRPVEKRDDRT